MYVFSSNRCLTALAYRPDLNPDFPLTTLPNPPNPSNQAKPHPDLPTAVQLVAELELLIAVVTNPPDGSIIIILMN